MNRTTACVFCILIFIAGSAVAAEKRVEQDTNHDGVIDQIAVTDDQGNALRLELYNDGPERPSAVQYYKNKILSRAEKDTNKDGKFDVVIEYGAQDQTVERQDVNFDGVFERETRYESGKRTRIREDANLDGKMERTTVFDPAGEMIKITVDENNDGIADEWQTFKQDCLESVEKDRNHDKKVDLKIFYIAGEKQRLMKDEDHDGYFEITQWFDRKPWTVVSEIDADADKLPESVWFYTAEGLAQKDIDANKDGRVDRREYFDAQSRLTKSEEAADGSASFNFVWFYDDAGNPVRAEKDGNGDGRPDIWYYYNDGRLTSVREDTRGDGSPDVWEEYDASETMIRQSRDLNADGIPDVTKEFKKPAGVSGSGVVEAQDDSEP
jgi:antitoxin component YwqK of YwqJK toxin-antitoxin module